MLPSMGTRFDEDEEAPLSPKSPNAGGGRFIDLVTIPGMDITGDEVEMDDFGGVPSMGGDDYDGGSPYFDEEEEEDLIDCSVSQYVPAVEFYADAGGCPQHLPIVNYNEFAGSLFEESLNFAKWTKAQKTKREKADASAVTGSTVSLDRDRVFETEYAKDISVKLRRVAIMNRRLAQLQNQRTDLENKEVKLLQALQDSDAQVKTYCLPSDPNEEKEEEEEEEEEFSALPGIEEETPEEQEARLEALRQQIEDLGVEIESLPSHMRGDLQMTRDKLEVDLIKATIPTMEEGSKEKEEAERKIALYNLAQLEIQYEAMDHWQRIAFEGKLEAMRKEVHPDKYPDVPDGTEESLLVQIKYETMMTVFRVPNELTFAQLTRDAMRYFDLDMNDEFSLSKPSPITGVGSEDPADHCIPNGVVLNSLTSDGVMGHRQWGPQMPELWLMLLVDNVEGGKKEWTGRSRSIIPEIPKLTLEERALLALQKRRRKQARYNCIVYCGFLFVLIVLIMGWIPTYNAFVMRRGMHTNLFEEDFSEDIVHFQKGFADIATSDEMYDWVNDIFIGALGLDDGGIIADNTRLIGGLRIRTHRVGEGSAYDCRVPAFASNWTKNNAIKCYAPFSTYSMITDSFGPCFDAGVMPAGVGGVVDTPIAQRPTGTGPCDKPIVYQGFEVDTTGMPHTEKRWLYSDEWFGLSTTSEATGISYPSGGYSVYVDADSTKVTAAFNDMKVNAWIDPQTRVNFIEFLTYNPNFNVFILVKVIFEFDAYGLCIPQVQYAPMVLDSEFSFFHFFCQVVYMIYIVYFYSRFYSDFLRAKLEYGSYLAFFIDGWNIMDAVIYGMALAYQVLWFVYILTPSRIWFDITRTYYQDMNNAAQISITIQNIHAVIIVFSFLKLFHFLNLSDQFALMSNTVINVTTDIFVFNVMLVVILLSFTVSGNQLFGSEVHGYRDLMSTLNTMFLVMLGDFDFEELTTVNYMYAVLWFIMFQVLVFMIMLNVFISIISESFCEEHSLKRSSLGEEVSVLMNSMYKGVAHRIQPLPDVNQGLPKPFFDPVTDDLVRDRDVYLSDRERKESFGGYNWSGAWLSYRGLPTDSGTTTAKIHFPNVMRYMQKD